MRLGVRLILVVLGGISGFLAGSLQADIIQTVQGAVPLSLAIIAGVLASAGACLSATAKPGVRCGCGREIIEDELK